MRKKSMAVAVLLWFFIGFLAAHKIYLGKTRQGLWLILLYFFVPLIVVTTAIIGMSLFGVELVPPDARPEDMITLLQDANFLRLASMAMLILAGIWLWDLIHLIRQVRAHNTRVASEIPDSAKAQESIP